MTSRTLLCAAAICGLAFADSSVVGPSSAQSAPPEFTIDVSGWAGGAQGNNETGEFSHCAISRPYSNGLTLALLMSPRYELNIGLLNPNWNLLPDEEDEAEAAEAEAEPEPEEEDEDEEPPVAEVNVDGAFVKPFPVRAVSDTVLMVTTGVDDQLVDLLMKGNNLDVATDYGNYRFALTGTFNSITALRGCIDTARRLAAEARATAGQARPSALTGEGLVSILRNSGLENAAVAPQDAASSPLALSYAWSLGALTGGVHQSPRTNRAVEIDKFTELYIDQFESTCTGEFSRSEGESEVIRDLYAVKSASMQCGDDASGHYVSLFVALDDNHYTAFFHQSSVADRNLADDATNRIRRLIQSQAGG